MEAFAPSQTAVFTPPQEKNAPTWRGSSSPGASWPSENCYWKSPCQIDSGRRSFSRKCLMIKCRQDLKLQVNGKMVYQMKLRVRKQFMLTLKKNLPIL